MQIKNKILSLLSSFFVILFLYTNTNADEFNISAIEITLDKKNNIVEGKGSVAVEDQDGKIIKSDKAIYKKSEELVIAEENVEVFDTLGNILTTDKARYDKLENIITTYILVIKL